MNTISIKALAIKMIVITSYPEPLSFPDDHHVNATMPNQFILL